MLRLHRLRNKKMRMSSIATTRKSKGKVFLRSSAAQNQSSGIGIRIFSTAHSTLLSTMLTRPKSYKYAKEQRSPIRGSQGRAHRPPSGTHASKYVGPPSYSHPTASHREAARRVIARKMKKIHHIPTRIPLYKPISKKPTKTRTGKGKGSVNQRVCPTKPGQISSETNGGISDEVARDIPERASQKLPIATRVAGLV